MAIIKYGILGFYPYLGVLWLPMRWWPICFILDHGHHMLWSGCAIVYRCCMRHLKVPMLVQTWMPMLSEHAFLVFLCALGCMQMRFLKPWGLCMGFYALSNHGALWGVPMIILFFWGQCQYWCYEVPYHTFFYLFMAYRWQWLALWFWSGGDIRCFGIVLLGCVFGYWYDSFFKRSAFLYAWAVRLMPWGWLYARWS